jgi:hypothetical protein
MLCGWEEEGKEMVENHTSLHLVPITGHSPVGLELRALRS